MFFAKSTKMYASFERIYDADGKVWVYAQAHDALVAKTCYKVIVNEYGQITQAQSDTTTYYYIGVPERAWSSGDIAKLQIGGYIVDMITPNLTVGAGHGLEMHNGAIADTANADYTAADAQFFVNLTPIVAATARTGILIPRLILSSS